MLLDQPMSRIPTLPLLLAAFATSQTSAPAHAETTAEFTVSAAIAAGCLIDGFGSIGNAGLLGSLDFGQDSALSTATRNASFLAAQTLRLRCTPGVNLTMAIDGGSHAASGSRNLQLGANNALRLAYSLCADAACSQPLAISSGRIIPVSGTNSNDVKLPIYGRLTLPGQANAGTYTDMLTVTLTW